MVGKDKLTNEGGKIGFLGHFQTFGYVTDDDTRTFLIRQALVGINAHLVFGEKHRGFHFPNVVIKCSRTHQQTVCSNAIGYLGRQVTHGDGVLERAWRHLAHLPKHSLVGVGEFEKRNVGSKTKGALDNEHQGIGQQ